MMSLSASDLSAVETAISLNRQRPGALLPILHDIQDTIGFVPPDAIPAIASALNLSRAEVHGVVTFYHHFRQSPPGRHSLQICQAESCKAMGSEALTASIKKLLGVEFHQTTADGAFSLEPVYCLGNCACSPAAMLDDQVYGRVTETKLAALIAEARKDA